MGIADWSGEGAGLGNLSILPRPLDFASASHEKLHIMGDYILYRCGSFITKTPLDFVNITGKGSTTRAQWAKIFFLIIK